MSSGHKAEPNALPKEAYAMTLEEVAAVMGLSRARVWQIERRALEKLARRKEAITFAALVVASKQLRRQREVME